MTFRTCIPIDEIQKSSSQINYTSKIGLIGSCFVENISEKLSYYKFPNWLNPHGIIFNPKAIEKALSDIVREKEYTENDLFFENECWHGWHHHSDFSSNTTAKTLKKINTSIQKTAIHLKETSHVIITLGTAWIYQHIETDQSVANCHKVPQKHFIKKILSIEEIVESLQNSITLIRKANPKIQIVLTLSPVRHLKDGMLANSRSKAHLLTAIHKIASNSDNAYYFPSYEIVLDDLRDYRFFGTDMVHPNGTAIDYVWNVFKQVWIAPKVYPVMKNVAEIQKGLHHKAFNPDSKQHKKFLDKLAEQQNILSKEYGIEF